MSQLITDVYTKYKIPPNLVRHQLEVTAVGRYICDHWTGEPVDKEKITLALLLHDLGNILKFKRPFLGELEPQAAYWESVQQEFIATYGKDVHHATKTMVLELKLPAVSALLEEMHDTWANPDVAVSLESRICEYADCTVTPVGIVGFEARIEDLKHRYSLTEESQHIMLARKNGHFVEEHVNVDLTNLASVDFSSEMDALRLTLV